MSGAPGDGEVFQIGAGGDADALRARVAGRRGTEGSTGAVEDAVDVTGPGPLVSQAEFNRALVGAVQGIVRHLEDVERRLHAIERRIDGEADVAARRAAAVEQSVCELRADAHAARLGLVEGLGRRVQDGGDRAGDSVRTLAHDLEALRMRVVRAERAASTTPASAPDPGSPAPAAAASAPGFDYFMFEHRFRGSIDDVRRRQAGYVDLFLGRDRVLDLGCGRGEFVELLNARGIPVIGVDADEDMAAFCRDRGLPVVRGDVFEYLRALPDTSVDGIFSAQVVEHLQPEQIMALVQLWARKLVPGGLVVVETVNTDCPEALRDFYLDPTHRRPVPPRFLSFLFEQGPFDIQALRFSAPVTPGSSPEVLTLTKGWSPEVIRYGDYAVIAVRR